MKDSEAKDLEQTLPRGWEYRDSWSPPVGEFWGPNGICLRKDNNFLEIEGQHQNYVNDYVDNEKHWDYLPIEIVVAFLEKLGYKVEKK